MRYLPALLFLLVVPSVHAATNVLRASAVPEPGLLMALGGGLVGLATLIRRHLNQ